MPRRMNLSAPKLAYAHAIVNYARKPPPLPKLRRRVRPHRRKDCVLKAIDGTRGLWSVLAKKLDCAVVTIQTSMLQDGWEFVRERWEEEKLRTRDGCVQNVYNIAFNSGSDGIRLDANKFLLEKTHPDFQTKTKLQIEGGDNPIRHQHAVLNITPDTLEKLSSAPKKVQAEFLEMLDEIDVPDTDR